MASRFEILGLLGTGGMGVVYKAQDRSLDDVVALKVLRTDLGHSEELAARFHSEIKLARRVSHRNVCRIYEYGEDDRNRYISMELVDGENLKDVVREKGAFPTAEALEIANQVLTGLHAIHAAGIIHRDLKTPNIMRDSRGVVRLTDFGIAKELGAATLTAAGQIVGTPEYISPDHVRGQKLDFRTDIYSFGIVLYELLTGVVPFLAATPLATVSLHVMQPPKLDRSDIPAPLRPVLGRALAKNREERYGSVMELAEALAAARRQLGLAPSPSFTAPPPSTSAPSPLAGPAPARRDPDESPTLRAMVEALHHPEAQVRRMAAVSLGDLGPRSKVAVMALVDALSDPDDRVRATAAAALGRIGPAAEDAVPALIETLEDEAAGQHAEESLVKIGRAAIPALIQVVESPHQSIRWHAASALTRIGAGS